MESAAQPSASTSTASSAPQQASNQSGQDKKPQRRRFNNNRKPVSKPRPKNEEKLGKRQVEINQIKRGYPQHVASENGVGYNLKLKPTDPDFPYDIPELSFTLFVPLEYPQVAPYIAVHNQDVPRGYAANVESGFRQMGQNNLGKMTLMNMTLQLDRNLEAFLSRQKQETMKVVRHKKPEPQPQKEQQPKKQPKSKQVKQAPPPRPNKVFVPGHVKAERERQIEKFKHRLAGQATLFNNSAETGATYSVHITPPHSEIIPDELTRFRALLFIPLDYNISPCAVRIPSVNDITARNVEANFNAHARNAKTWSLVALVNYLTTQVERLMLSSDDWAPIVEEPEPELELEAAEEEVHEKRVLSKLEKMSIDPVPASTPKQDVPTDPTNEPKAESDGDLLKPENEQSQGGRVMDEMPPLDLRGTSLNLPGLRLSHIGFLECQTLNLIVKCSRCKTTNDVLNLVSAPYGRDSKATGVQCCKCNQTLAVAFRKDLVHASNSRAGLLDFSNCEPSEMLPSSFTPTCEQCSTTLPSPFRKMEIGKPCNANCRECHLKMTMFIPEYRFELISEDSMGDLKLKVRKSKNHKESLGIVGGTPLPHDGTCTHYKKSYRWMRFSCCGKVHACDKCHDEKSDHPNERAHRMICGKCSREQNFGGVCVYCRHTYDTRHSGFWEGGTGERNKSRLSRKDPRKYSRKGVRNSAK